MTDSLVNKFQALVLDTIDKHGTILDSGELSLDGKPVDQLQLLGILNSLTAHDFVRYTPIERETWVLTKEGKQIVDEGSHEVKVYNAVAKSPNGVLISELTNLVGGESAKIGQGKAFKNKWIKKDGDRLLKEVDSVVDQTQQELQQILNNGIHQDDVVKELKKRKLIDKQKVTTFKVEKGNNFATTVKKQAADLTAEMLANGSWKDQTFKKYNFEAAGVAPDAGALHPLMKVREEFRQIFFEMGFQEMPTNQFVESSFWNFDALFQPQQHPSRDMHDTFFLKDPETDNKYNQEYAKRVKEIHSNGGFGSVGYGYDWKYEEADKLILRTHTTARSSFMLYQLAQQKEFRPVKYFSIDRVFRNETVDATHLAEFHQVEGLIADRGLTLGDLIGFLNEFFKKMGISQIKFKPAYNPYTEPSMEIFSYHQGLKKWVEVGNSGMFRPEMLRPMGLPEDVTVIAWGLSLERPTMIKYSIDNIRELLGHKVDINFIKNSPVVRFDKAMGKELMTKE